MITKQWIQSSQVVSNTDFKAYAEPPGPKSNKSHRIFGEPIIACKHGVRPATWYCYWNHGYIVCMIPWVVLPHSLISWKSAPLYDIFTSCWNYGIYEGVHGYMIYVWQGKHIALSSSGESYTQLMGKSDVWRYYLRPTYQVLLKNSFDSSQLTQCWSRKYCTPYHRLYRLYGARNLDVVTAKRNSRSVLFSNSAY